MAAAGAGARGIVTSGTHAFNVHSVLALIEGEPQVVVVFSDSQFGGHPGYRERATIDGFLRTYETGGGAVADHPLTDPEREWVVEAMRGARDAMTPLDEVSMAMPRAPPGAEVLVWDGEFPVSGVVAFGWAERGVVVITWAVAEQIAARFAMDPVGFQAWWERLLIHERDFHLSAHPDHTGPRHDADAAPIAAGWFGWVAPGAPRPMTGGGGARSPPPAAVTVWIWHEKRMPLVEFRRKAGQLLQLSDAGLLHKAKNPVPRDPWRHEEVPPGPHNEDHDLVRFVEFGVHRAVDPPGAGSDGSGSCRRAAVGWQGRAGEHPDVRPVHQPGDRDSPAAAAAEDLAGRHAGTDRGGGHRKLGERIAEVVGAGASTYQDLEEMFAVPKAVLRRAVREDDTLREVGRRHAVRRVDQSRDRSMGLRMHELSIVGGLAMLSHLAGWQFAAATVLGFAGLALVLVGVKAVVAAVRRPGTRDAPAEDVGAKDVLEPKR